MKSVKTIILFVICFLYTQTEAQLIRSMSVKGGVIAANQKWNYSGTPMDTKTRYGLDVGLSLEWLDYFGLSVLTEAHYLQNGMKDEIPVTTAQFPDGTGQYIVRSPRIDYTSLFILAKYKYEFQTISIYALAGPRLDILLNTYGDGFDIIVDKFNKTDIGATFGVGIELSELSPLKPGLEFRYNPGFKSSYSSQFLSVTNRSMEFLISVMF